MDVAPAGPARKRCGRARVANRAVASGSRHVIGIGCRALRALGAFTRIGTVVAGVAAAAAHRRVRHRVGRETRCSIRVAVAALHDAGRNMWRRGQAQCGGAVVATRTIGVARLMRVGATGPTVEGRSRGGVAGDAVAPRGRHVARI